MAAVLCVDRVEVLVLVDNVTDSLSTNPNTAASEWAGLSAAGRLPSLSGCCTCCAHHGLSLLITAHAGSAKRTVLFDTGRFDANSIATIAAPMIMTTPIMTNAIVPMAGLESLGLCLIDGSPWPGSIRAIKELLARSFNETGESRGA